MSGKSINPLIVVVVLNASFTLLLILFVAHQQFEIANLKEMVQKNVRNKEYKVVTKSNITYQEETKFEDTRVPEVLFNST